jgi:multicomponent Na+:H+ antiporter subunit E
VAALRLTGVLRYLGYFAVQSIRGGVDVSLRALRPSMPLNPGFLSLDLGIEPEGLRILFAWTVSLLPGTASVHLDGQRLHVHVLCNDGSAQPELERLETVIRGLARPSR